jgi:RNA polymerase sigma-70 factor (ECF subfamily)
MTASPIPASIQDGELVRRTAEGDRNAFGCLFDRYHQLALNLAWRVLNERPEAEDVVQEVFLQLWRDAASYKEARGSVSTWIVTIARSRAIDKLRSRKARRIADPSAESEEFDDLAERLPDLEATPETLDRRLLVTKAFESLAVEQRVVIEMAYYEGMSQSEIAEALREPLGTIKTRIRSGLIKLKQALGSGLEN